MPRIDVEVRDDTLKIGPRFSVSFMRHAADPRRRPHLPAAAGPRPLPDPARPGLRATACRRAGASAAACSSRCTSARRCGCASRGGWPPDALKVGVGKVYAITGKPWSETLDGADPELPRRAPSSRGWTASTPARARSASSSRCRSAWATRSRARSPARSASAASSSWLRAQAGPVPGAAAEACTTALGAEAVDAACRRPRPADGDVRQARGRSRAARDGPRRGRPDGAEALPGPVRRRRVGHRRVRPLLRPHRQQRDVAGHHRRAPPPSPVTRRVHGRTATRGSRSTTST